MNSLTQLMLKVGLLENARPTIQNGRLTRLLALVHGKGIVRVQASDLPVRQSIAQVHLGMSIRTYALIPVIISRLFRFYLTWGRSLHEIGCRFKLLEVAI